MDDPGAVRRVERAGNLQGKRCDLRGIERPPAHPGFQCFAVNVLHHDEVNATCRAQLVDRRDIGMIECRRRLCFAHEASSTIRMFISPRGQDLERD